MPASSLVLGGLDGIRQRLRNPRPDQRAAALSDALEYGPRGLNLVLRALQDRSEEVRQTAYDLLKERNDPKVVQAIEWYVATDQRFRPLEQALLAGRWREADQETLALLCRATGVAVGSPIRVERLDDIPCIDLRLIDRLWVKASQGRFGFSVQRSIWQWYTRLLAQKNDVWSAFSDRVGWRVNNLFVQNHWKKYPEITFSLHAPRGHLPFMGDKFGIFTVEAITNRLEQCQIER